MERDVCVGGEAREGSLMVQRCRSDVGVKRTQVLTGTGGLGVWLGMCTGVRNVWPANEVVILPGRSNGVRDATSALCARLVGDMMCRGEAVVCSVTRGQGRQGDGNGILPEKSGEAWEGCSCNFSCSWRTGPQTTDDEER